ncbi:transcriptional regulator NrdR, partial [Candidatus Woesearchaeota archaeon]|nr:transcriptional regulator NrdR [Candidatus Woesearchaeota archaeon]
MKCPFCGESETKVIDSRESDEQTRRRRECEKCSKRFTTYEKVENINLIVLKKGGKKETFDVEKIRKGVERAAEKRLEKEKIDSIVEIIEQKLRSMETNEIDSKKIGEEVMNQLKKVDKVSYIRFASV